MHWLAALILLAQLSTLIGLQYTVPFAARASAQAGSAAPVITDFGAKHKFGQTIDFRASIEPGSGVREVWLSITPEGQQTVSQIMQIGTPEGTPPAFPEATATPGENSGETAGGEAFGDTPTVDIFDGAGAAAQDIIEATASVDVRQMRLTPFSRIDYYYQATLEDGTKIKSETSSFNYDDNRFEWQTAENAAFQAHWTGGDAALGQLILSIAQDGLHQAQDVLAADPPGPIRIYAYSSSRDLQSALQLTGQPYIAGHTTPETGMIMISVPAGPERKLELERQIPHEVMHILQYQVMGKQYTRQPVWLVEGMASLAELTQNPEYRRVLETTAREGKLLPISSLCAAFPRDASGAFLAYAQSDSFLRFLHQKYGTSGLRRLIEAYQNGLGCEEGVASALGVSLRQIEYRWQLESLGMNAGALALDNLSPYLLLGLVVLIIPAVTFLIPHKVRKTAPQGSIHD